MLISSNFSVTNVALGDFSDLNNIISKKSLGPVFKNLIILTIRAPNDNAKSISVQCAPPHILPHPPWGAAYHPGDYAKSVGTV